MKKGRCLRGARAGGAEYRSGDGVCAIELLANEGGQRKGLCPTFHSLLSETEAEKTANRVP